MIPALFLTKLKDLLFYLQDPKKTVPTRVNISKSTIPIHQAYVGERELERGAYSNLQQARRPGSGWKKENMTG